MLNFLNYLKKCKLKWQTKFLTLLSQFAFKFIVGPPPPLLKDLPKIESLWGGLQNFLLERGDKPEKGAWCRKGGLPLFLLLYSSITFTVCGGKVRFHLLLFRSSVFWVSHAQFSSKSLTPDIICKFLIHSGSLQKMLTALFNLVWNTQKSKWENVLSAKARCFLVLKRFKKDKWGRIFHALPYCISPHFWDEGVTLLLSYI